MPDQPALHQCQKIELHGLIKSGEVMAYSHEFLHLLAVHSRLELALFCGRESEISVSIALVIDGCRIQPYPSMVKNARLLSKM